MSNPRVIIAETNATILNTLQKKFSEELFRQIDLEIIDDENYYKKYMSLPQRADVLVVSQQLYETADLQRLNIEYVFVLTDRDENEDTDVSNINKIYTYNSNIGEIFGEIMKKSGDSLKQNEETGKKNSQLVLVTSAAGGTGKTALAMGICGSLSRSHRTLYINAAYIHTFQIYMENDSVLSNRDVENELVCPTDDIYQKISYALRNEGFDYLPPFRASLISLGIPFDVFLKLAVSARESGDYDYVVIDSNCPYDDNCVEMLNAADRVIIVTEQTKASVYATNTMVSNINGITDEKYLFVCNKHISTGENYLINSNISRRFNVKYNVDFVEISDISCDDFAKLPQIQKIARLLIQ